MLAVIDYGAGNLRSVLHALKHLQAPQLRLAQKPEHLDGASKIILPGVGAFGAAMAQMRAQRMIEPLRQALAQGTPYLGICVGMQMLFDIGEEMGEHEGLGLISGRVVRFPPSNQHKVPHMGWNQLDVKTESKLTADLGEKNYAYFVHSYYCAPTSPTVIAATADYGLTFAAAVQQDHIYGVQFHPEKSQRTGLRILSNFLRL